MLIKIYTKLRQKLLENQLFWLHIKMIAERVANSYWNGFCPTYYSEREEEIRKKMQRGKCENCPSCKECTGQSSCKNNEKRYKLSNK